jgi:glycoside/pentoside/hexuronide:cation symporter, GPH family
MSALHTRQILAYGLLGLPLAFAALPLYVHLPRFYTETTALPLATVGALLLGARLLDALLDPWLGWLADHVPRQRMLALALLPFGAGFMALFHPPAEATIGWLLACLALTYAGFSGASIAHQAWATDLAPDAAGRTRLAASREGFGLLGVVGAAAIPALLASNTSEGVARLAWLLPPLLLGSAALAFTGLPATGAAAPPATPFLNGLRTVLANPPFRQLLAVFVLNGIAAALPATLFLFFVADVLGREAASGPLLALYFVSGAASMPVWVRIAARWGRVAAWLTAMAVAIASFACAGFLGAGDVAAFAIVCLASGLALGADLAMPAALVTEIGQRLGRAGACFGVWNFVASQRLVMRGSPVIGASARAARPPAP